MNKFEETIKEIKEGRHKKELIDIINSGKKIIIFGAGNCGHRVYENLKSENAENITFCDNGLRGRTDALTGEKIIGIEDLKEDKNSYIILVSVADMPVFAVIKEQLLSLGFRDENIKCMCAYIEQLAYDFLDEHEKEYRAAYELMEDEFSKEVFIERMKRVYLLTDVSKIASPHEEEYYDKVVKLSDNEVFIDCGGFDGDSAVDFINKVNGKYKKIYVFEPEESKRENIIKNLKGANYELYMKGVWDENTTLYFEEKDSDASCVSKVEGIGTKIEVVALDKVLVNEIPTYIKMDIEGSEKNALLGTKNIIEKYKPKLAICVYHKPEDLYELPVLIKKLNPEYKLYMRHYSDNMYSTVCYAI